MTKRYYSKRYTRKRSTKYLIIGLILAFVILAASAYTDIPQLEPIRKQIELFKSGIGGSELSIVDTGEIDGLAITVDKVSLVRSLKVHSDLMEHKISATRSAQLLIVNIKVENIGKTKKSFPPPRECISVHYTGGEKQFPEVGSNLLLFIEPFYYFSKSGKFSRTFEGYIEEYEFFGDKNKCIIYPDEIDEGFFIFEVPEGIEPEGTTFRIEGLVWDFGKKSSTIDIRPLSKEESYKEAEKWKVNEVLDVIVDSIPDMDERYKSYKPTVIVLSDYALADGETYHEFINLREDPLTVIYFEYQEYFQDAYIQSIINNINKMDYVIYKQGGHYIFVSPTNEPKEKMDMMRRTFEEYIENYTLLEKFNLPDGSVLEIYKNKKFPNPISFRKHYSE